MTSSPLYRHLASSQLFANVDDEQLARLEPELQRIRLEAGDVLLRQGEPADHMYVLVEGELAVSVTSSEGSEVTLDRLAPGAVVGEMALVVAQKRSATVTATEPSELVQLARTDFEALAAEHPELVDAVVRQSAPRLQRIQLGNVLETWFDVEDPAAIRTLQNQVEWVQLGAGEVLYDEGDEARGSYIVVGGRIRLQRRDQDGELHTVADVGRGGSLGEEGVLADATRPQRAVALRDSHVVHVTREVAETHPSVLLQTARSVVARHRTPSQGGQRPRAFALVPLGDPRRARAVAASLAQRLAAWGSVVELDADAVDRALGRSGAAQVEADSPFHPSLTHWLNEQANEFDHVLLLADAAASAWTRRSVRQADVVLLVADAGDDAEPTDLEAVVAARNEDVQLVLVHPADTERPSGTSRWLDHRPEMLHHHVREGHDGDAARLARRLTGRAQGLVFSGGGARGYVHIGLIKALHELEIPVDWIAGTSMGSVVGGGYALTKSYEFCYRTAATFGDPKQLLDRTLPIVALNRSHAVTNLYRTMFEDARIEDLWTPFFCVSANLTKAEPVVHERGPLWEAVRASSAIPGVFTPLVVDGDVLVDGGVMNNFPVDLMRERIGTGTVIGSNAYTQNSRSNEYSFGPSVSGWRVLREKIVPFGTKRRYPSMLGTLMRATSLSSKHLSEAAPSLADLVLRYPTEDYATLEFDKYDELIEIGYGRAIDILRRHHREVFAPSR